MASSSKIVLRILQKRSSIGSKKGQKRTLIALGLRKRGKFVEHTQCPSIEGMIAKVAHLVEVETLSNFKNK